MTVQDSTAASPGPGRAFEAQAALDPIEPENGRAKKQRPPKGVKTTWRAAFRKDWQLYSLVLLPMVFFLIFRYLPVAGNVIAFRRFRAGSGNIFGDEWVGLHYVRMFVENPQFWNVFWNTVILGGLSLLIVFPLPIILALLLNELRSRKFKRFVQTVSYLPHFLSIVIVAGITLEFVSANGTFNQILESVGRDRILFMQDPAYFRPIFIGSEIWQTVGWGTILYLAALTTIDEQLYEAARIDGANRWKQTWHITLPGIRPTMIVLLILNIGTFMAVGFEKVLLLYNELVYPTADIIATYVYRVGIFSSNYSFGAAIGLFEAIIGLTLILSANAISRRVVGTSLW